jgi:DNA-binding MarR family transcriptional regulator
MAISENRSNQAQKTRNFNKSSWSLAAVGATREFSNPFQFRMIVSWPGGDEEHSRMVRDELSVMSAFLAVADERSFTKAAKRLGVTQSALSHAIRGLEEQVGVRLLARTTRSVAPTEAGEQLLAELRPALTGIRGALDRIGGLRDTPRGRVRLLVPRLAAMSVLGPKLAVFARTYPDVVLDVSTDED